MIRDEPELFAQVAAVNPGLVSTLHALEGQLQSGPLPPPDVLAAYGQYLCRLGAAIIGLNEQLVIDVSVGEQLVAGAPLSRLL